MDAIVVGLIIVSFMDMNSNDTVISLVGSQICLKTFTVFTIYRRTFLGDSLMLKHG